MIRQSAKIVRSIGDFNSLCNFGESNFNTPICAGALVTAVVIFRYRMLHRVRNGYATPRGVPILWQAEGDSTLRLLSQPAWNDVVGWGFGVGIVIRIDGVYDAGTICSALIVWVSFMFVNCP